jgi:hypothetical protein
MIDNVLNDKPIEEAAYGTKKMVIASRSFAGARWEEILDEPRREFVHVLDIAFDEETI